MENDRLADATSRALEMAAARSEPVPKTGVSVTVPLVIAVGIGAPLVWQSLFWRFGMSAHPMFVGAMLAAVPSALLVASVAFAISDRWGALALAAFVGQVLGSLSVAFFAALGMEGHPQAATYGLLLSFFAPLPLYPLAAFVGALRAEWVQRRRRRPALSKNDSLGD